MAKSIAVLWKAHGSLSLRLDKGGYAKHGTGIAVRLLVIDEFRARPRFRRSRASVRAVRGARTIPPRAALRVASPVRPKLSLFRSVKGGPARPVIVRAPQTNEVRPVAYQVLEEAAAMGEQRGVYADYRPSRVVAPKQVSIRPIWSNPPPWRQSPPQARLHSVPARADGDRAVALAQLETVIYAGEAWAAISTAASAKLLARWRSRKTPRVSSTTPASS